MRGKRLVHAKLSQGLWITAALLLAASGCAWSPKSINSQGVGLYHQGNYDGALALFHQAVSLEPNNPNFYYNLARVHHQKGRQTKDTRELEKAETYYNLCLDRDPNHTDCYRSLAVLLVEQGRKQDAFTLLERWNMRSPHLADPKIELARLYEETGDLTAAKEKLLAALQVEPNNSRALAALGHVRERQGDLVQALADYKRSLAVNPAQPKVALRAAALQGQGVVAQVPMVNPPTTLATRPGPLFR